MFEIKDTTSPRELTALFRRYGLEPNRRLGQNFLIDANVARKIVAAAEIRVGDAVIEVGPGAGALTSLIAAGGADLLALEIDRGLSALLEEIFSSSQNVRIIREDVLKVSLRKLIGEYFSPAKDLWLISNLPYNISGPFMYRLFREAFPFFRAVLMFQKEVARRLVAAPGESDYSGLSVLCRYYCTGRILFHVSKNVFWPRPKVDSAVILLEPRERALGPAEESHFTELVQAMFQHRRKTVFNSLSRLYPRSRDRLPHLLAQAEIKTTARPEELTVEQFAMLTRITYNERSTLS